MIDYRLQLNVFYSFCDLLKSKCIRDEFNEVLVGYNLNSLERKDGKLYAEFINHNGIIFLIVDPDYFIFKKRTENIIEEIKVNSNMILLDRKLEKREKGVIYSSIMKNFAFIGFSSNECALAYLSENRYVNTNENIKRLCNKNSFEDIFQEMTWLEDEIDLSEESNSYSNFIASIKYYFDDDLQIRVSAGDINQLTVYQSREDVTNIYSNVWGFDRIYRIYDLYRGIINSRNEKDIFSIYKGRLSSEAYDLKELVGITDQENLLVGKSDENLEEYYNYLKGMLDCRFYYKGELSLDRDCILRIITDDDSKNTSKVLNRKV